MSVVDNIQHRERVGAEKVLYSDVFLNSKPRHRTDMLPNQVLTYHKSYGSITMNLIG